MAAGFAKALGADAVVDLSGPGQWHEAPTAAQAAPTLTMPVLAAMSAQDSGDRAPVEAMVQAAPSQHKAFVWLEAGHGWELLTEHGYEVHAEPRGSGTVLVMEGPDPVLLGYAPLAWVALRRLVAR